VGDPYESVCLMGASELDTAFKTNTTLDVRIEVAPIPAEEIRFFGRTKAALARTYKRWVQGALGQAVFRRCGAFFRLTGRANLLIPEILSLYADVQTLAVPEFLVV
jgi:hypothetical protein